MIRYLPCMLLLMAASIPAATEVTAQPADPAVTGGATSAGTVQGVETTASIPAPAPAPAPAPVLTPAAVAAPGPIDAALAEIAFWNAIKASENSADYRQYLARYPAGSFVDLAEFRIRELDTRRMLAEAVAEWRLLKDGEDLEAIEGFIQRYPQSPWFAEAETKAQTLRPLTLVVHYLRRDQVLLGWKLKHALSQTVVAFDRLDEVGAVAQLSVKAKLAARRSGLTLLHGDRPEECVGQREMRWDRPTEIWLLEQDCTAYASLAQAQKVMQERVVPPASRRLHYLRRDAQETGWGFALRSDKLLGGLFSLGGRKDVVPLSRRDAWGVYADWKEQEGQSGATLTLELSSEREQKDACDKPLRWPAEAGAEAWYVSGSCTLLFRLDAAIAARRQAADKAVNP